MAMTMTPLRALRAARRLLTDNRKWCQGASARDYDGRATDVHDPHAVAWCAGGALWKVVPGTLHGIDNDVCDRALQRLCEAATGETEAKAGAANLNDDSDHVAVLAMYDKAIRFEEWEEEIYA